MYDDEITLAAPGVIHDGLMLSLATVVIGKAVSVADIMLTELAEGGQEAQINFLIGDGKEGRDALEGWSRLVGHRRIWFSDEMVEPCEALDDHRGVSSRCRHCGLTWRDQGRDFWLGVRRLGFTRLTCPLCGSSLPQAHLEGQGALIPTMTTAEHRVGIAAAEWA